jgi:addiction module HigA family antidote
MARDIITPGEHLAGIIAEAGLTAAELARQLKVPTNRITLIVNGQRSVTGDTALRLGHFFRTTPEFWLNLQALYDLRVAEAASGAEIRRLPRFSKSRRRKPPSVQHVRQ